MIDERDLVVRRGGAAGVRPTRAVAVAQSATQRYQETEQIPPHRADARSLRVGRFMSKPARTTRGQARLGAILEALLSTGLQRLPVVGPDGRVCGMISQTDLMAHAQRDTAWRQVLVSKAMSTPVVRIAMGASLREAAELLLQSGHGGLPVVDAEDRPVGFLSAKDLLAVIAAEAPIALWA